MKLVHLDSAFQEAANKVDISCLLGLTTMPASIQGSKCQSASQSNELNNYLSRMTFTVIILTDRVQATMKLCLSFFFSLKLKMEDPLKSITEYMITINPIRFLSINP